MWGLLSAAIGTAETSPAEAPAGEALLENAAFDEAAFLKEEAEELQAKLEAMRMADYREQLRAAVAASNPADPGDLDAPQKAEEAAEEVVPDSQQNAEAAAQPEGIEHFALDDETPYVGNELDDMYDFERFSPGDERRGQSSEEYPAMERCEARASAEAPPPAVAALPASTPPAADPAPPPPPMAEATAAQAFPPTRSAPSAAPAAVAALAAAPSTDSSAALTVATQALSTMRGHAEELRRHLDQSGLHDLLAALFQDLEVAETAVRQASEAERRAPPKAEEEFDFLEGINREQVMELAQLTEELTDALDAERENVKKAKRKLEQESRRARKLEESANFLAQQVTERDAELESARRRLAEEETARSDDRQSHSLRIRELEERVAREVMEAKLGHSLASKGKVLLHKHLEV
eukprot:TRINITY_DN15730_c0_g1_i2.p1 TRINITY_DN15730_c0_g1~~TRINITY_DN15730_c0_g1_i2.p1  ORF type:complete len:456 (+),score=129.93 TRINITY_DN15730_c0_g1_i2:140-1369(+)